MDSISLENTLGGRPHVAVLMGGWSSERDVSLVSGRAVVRTLGERGYRVTAIDVTPDLSALLAALEPRPDVVFNALHGRGGEDGTMQGILDMLGLPYTHSGALASAIAMDKPTAKRLLATVGVPSPRGGVVSLKTLLATGTPVPAPYVIKPTNEGSSVGVVIVQPGDNPLTFKDWRFGDTALVEEYIPGRELTVGVMGGKALTVTEIVPSQGFYDYTAKYSDEGAWHVVPARIPGDVATEAKRLASLVHETLGCRGVTRSDFRWDDSRPGAEGLFFLEVNTQPGLTPLSLIPEQALSLGIDFATLVTWMVEDARCHA